MKQPNILYVFPDQFSCRALGFRNEYPVKTPNLDAFAKDSLVLDNAISNFPVCSPYRAMLMTGKYPHKTGVMMNCNHPRNSKEVFLKKHERCISDVLAENGYDLGYIGKWHLDPPEVSHRPYIDDYRDGVLWDSYTLPSRRHQIGFWHSYGASDTHLTPHYYHNDATFDNPTRPDEWSITHEGKVARDYITNKNNDRDESKPFMLFLANNPPHPPYESVPQEYVDIYKDMTDEELLPLPNFRETNPPERSHLKDVKGGDQAKAHVREYFAAITGLDEEFGKIIETLKEKGIYDDTIIIFTSDHGDMMGCQNLMGKTFHYAESIKVPFMIRYPKAIKPGKNDMILNVVDIMPTLLNMVGLSDKIPQEVQGEDKCEFLYGNNDSETSGLYFNYYSNTRGLKTPEYTFVSEMNYAEEETRIFLYDDINDPYQLKEISDKNPEIVDKLRKEMNIKLKEIDDARWM